MEDELLSLTWNNHGSTYRHTLNLLRQENTLTDVTLACDGQKFTAHKLILVTCSDYFRHILSDVPCQHPIVYMRGISAKEMQALIDFMYTGQTDIPQKEVPLLLSTAEALQIKGLGVFNSSDGKDKGATCQEGHESISMLPRKKPSESSVPPSPKDNLSIADPNRTTLQTVDSNFLENIYSHHYALMSSPKRRKAEDRNTLKSEEYTDGSHSSSTGVRNTRINCLSPHLGKMVESNLDSLYPLREPNSIRNDFCSPSSLSQSTPSSSVPISTYSNISHIPVHQSRVVDQTKHNASSQEPLHDPRPETKTASPRALNYTLAGLRRNKEDYSVGSLANILEESNTGVADTPEHLIKSEVKDEALDFTNTALSESAQRENVSLNANSIEEETRIYLDAFARSANLSKNIPIEETQEAGSTDGRPFSCPICRKSFAKAAILKRHHLAHFRPYVCHICTRSFTRREVLAEHLLEHNGADLRLPCPVCNMTIKRKRNLQAHIKVKHPDYYKQKIANRDPLC